TGPPPPPDGKTGPVTKIPVFRIISGSKIDSFFNQPSVWQKKATEFIEFPVSNRQDRKSQTVNNIAVKLEDNSLFPPCVSGTIFITETPRKPKPGDIVLVVIRNYRSWMRELNKIESVGGREMFTFRPYNNDYESIKVASDDIVALYSVDVIILSSPNQNVPL
ncbi:MAG: S24 family peptidase, partial [Planctomycetota bacterium]|nr:S24 family peptidase [Planctomycetota bacterium]MDI6788174.1 S24 family peptidase [Planctomycetota bacterium]